MIIFKRTDSPFVTIPNSTAQNTELSITALGALTRMASYSRNFQCKVEWLQTSWGIGRDKLRSVLRELREAGHLKITPIQGQSGLMCGQEWSISIEPVFLEDSNRTPENPWDGESDARNHRGTVDTEDNKKEESIKKEEKDSVLRTGDKVAAAAKPPSAHTRVVDHWASIFGKDESGKVRMPANKEKEFAQLKKMFEEGFTAQDIITEMDRQVEVVRNGGTFHITFCGIRASLINGRNQKGLAATKSTIAPPSPKVLASMDFGDPKDMEEMEAYANRFRSMPAIPHDNSPKNNSWSQEY